MKIIFILVLVLFSCKKRHCDILNQKSEDAWAEYEEASQNNSSNPTEKNKSDAIEKFEAYEQADRDFLQRGCYHSKYQ